MTRWIALAALATLPLTQPEPQDLPKPASPAPTTLPSTPPATRPATPLPSLWHGHYVGTVELLRPGRGATSDPVHMELLITPRPDDPLKVGWTIIYGTGDARQERPYELASVPGYTNRFLMDEKNGIFIDHALLGTSLVSQFRVGTTLLMSRFERTDDGIFVEIHSFQTTPSRVSQPEGANFDVESYPSTTVQRGRLKRQ